ncbi:MAG: hypothetical protein WBP93_16695 [Pyrinomonadaceae bacterium]
MPRPKTDKESDLMRRAIHHRLHRRALIDAPVLSGAHLDEDALSAFSEGRLSEREATPIVSHLVACASCRHITTQLIRLASETTFTESASPEQKAEPGRARAFLEGLASRLFAAHEDEAVFAYHAPAEDFERKNETHGKGEESVAESSSEEKQDEPSK